MRWHAPTRVRSVALYGFIGSGNLGNDASFETVLSWLRAVHPTVDVRCITIAPEAVAARYGVPSVPLAACQVRPGTARPLAIARKVVGRILDVPRSVVLTGTVDAVIVPGMGVLEESMGVRPWGLPWWLFLVALSCRLRRRPFVLLDVGAEPIRNPVTRWLMVLTVGLAAHVSYRDEWSANAMQAAGARAPEAIVPDLVFAHPSPTSTRPEAGVVAVGVMAYYGPSDDPAIGAEVHRRYVASLTEALLRLLDDGDRVVLLRGDRADAAVARHVAAVVGGARPGLPPDALAVRDVSTFADLTRELAQAEVVVASRFHNVIGALRLGRPTLSLSYAEKNSHLLRGLGLGDVYQDIEQLDAERLVRQVRAVRADPSVTARIAEAIAGLEGQVTELLHRTAVQTLGLPDVAGICGDLGRSPVRKPELSTTKE